GRQGRKPPAFVNRKFKPPEASDRRDYEILYLFRLPHVGLHENSLTVSDFDRLHRLRTRGIDVADHNLCAASGKKKRRSSTNAAASARNQHNFVRKIESVPRQCFHLEAEGEEIVASFGKMVFQ